MIRTDNRTANQLRPINIELTPIRYPEGSALIRMGETHVLCAVSVQDGVPNWRRDSGMGWLTAEYALLPRATHTRTARSHIKGGRAQEIRRLIGRSLRRAVDLELLGNRTITIDCDVLQADGGTRTASINGAYVAVALALHKLETAGLVAAGALKPPIAAISVGLVNDKACLDLNYGEDSTADMDLNVVMDANGDFIEIQGTAEGKPIHRQLLNQLLDTAVLGINDIVAIQREALKCVGINV